MKRGKLIVIDGTDGSGKETQTRYLVRRLRKENVRVKTMSFPQYHTKSAGMVENYLEGRYGKNPNDVNPYAASIFYAVDRFDASRIKIRKWLDEGHVVVLDRYVSANMGHQGTKIRNVKKRRDFFSWVMDLEFRLFELPKPDLRFILFVDPVLSQRLSEKKWKKKKINLRKRDIHESNLDHLKQAARVYRELAEILPKTKLVECMNKEGYLSRQDIHEMLWRQAERVVKR